MKSRIIVAGAGHGGLSAAASLAQAGFDVTVIEKKQRKDTGFDWHDTFRINCFTDAGIPLPPPESYITSFPLTFTNPAKTVKLSVPDTNDGTNCSMDRKYLINYLIKHAENSGVKFCFGTEVTGIIADSNGISGIVTTDKKKKSAIFADLVIDACGMNSAVRRLLPSITAISNDINSDSIFTAYRAYFSRRSETNPPHPYTVHLFHLKKPGISWVIAHKDYFDILIGRFGNELTDEDINEAIDDLQKEYPSIGNNIIRGGSVEPIPLGRTLPLIVADGYAAVGDSAAMTIPIMGSGIANSIRAGRLLADTVISHCADSFTRKSLWKYQYDYFTRIGNNLVIADKLREICTRISAEDIDYAMEKELLCQNDITSGITDGFSTGYIVQKIIKALPKLPVITSAAITLSKHNSIKKVLSEMPEEYDEELVMKWIKSYNDI